MPVTIQGSRKQRNGLDQEAEVRRIIESGDTCYVFMNRVYFATEIEREVVKYRALIEKPLGAA